jgi:peroxiredoxin Q/BCP
MALPLGSLAPDFTLPSQTGEPVRLSDLTEQATVVLYFYPRDGTPGCTAESCAFRDAFGVFKDAGAEVVGVSRDNVESHQRFASQHELHFKLLSDPSGAVHELYKVKYSIPWLLRGRETFVIDRRRVVRHHFSSQLKAKKHVAEALRIVQLLASEPAEAPASASK